MQVPYSTSKRIEEWEQNTSESSSSSSSSISSSSSSSSENNSCTEFMETDARNEYEENDSDTEMESDESEDESVESYSESEESEQEEIEIAGENEDDVEEGDVEEITGGVEVANLSDDSSDDSEDDSIIQDLIYDNSRVTVDEAVYHVLSLLVEESLKMTTFKKFLATINALLPEGHIMPTSVGKVLAYLDRCTDSADLKAMKHLYCPECKQATYNVGKIVKNCSCGNIACEFFDLSIASQLKNLFENHQLAKKLIPFSLKQNQDKISDITTGSEYIRVNSREDRGSYDVTLLLNTDGLQLVKSNTSQCWAAIFSICELPLHLRESCLIFAGIWFDRKIQPVMNIFFRPIVDNLIDCYHKGIEWNDRERKKKVISKVVVPGVVADGPARAKLQNITNYNGYKGCNLCEFPTTPVEVPGKARARRVYLYTGKEEIKLRDGERMKKHARLAVKKQKRVRGVKGPSVLSDLPLLDLGTCITYDGLHALLRGAFRQLFVFWFFKKGPWNIAKHLKEIKKMLAEIQPPSTVNRPPESPEMYKFYKASDFLYWIIFWAAPVISSFLPSEYFQHFILFQGSVFALLESDITIEVLNEVEKALNLFLVQLGELYEPAQYTYNMHQLLHLPLQVRRWGMIWNTWTFCFESYNNYIANCAHGTKHLGTEIMNRTLISQKFNIMRLRIEHNLSVRQLCSCWKRNSIFLY